MSIRPHYQIVGDLGLWQSNWIVRWCFGKPKTPSEIRQKEGRCSDHLGFTNGHGLEKRRFFCVLPSKIAVDKWDKVVINFRQKYLRLLVCRPLEPSRFVGLDANIVYYRHEIPLSSIDDDDSNYASSLLSSLTLIVLGLITPNQA